MGDHGYIRCQMCISYVIYVAVHKVKHVYLSMAYYDRLNLMSYSIVFEMMFLLYSNILQLTLKKSKLNKSRKEIFL